jgi:LPXTG-motif cell wall-anchored protein
MSSGSIDNYNVSYVDSTYSISGPYGVRLDPASGLTTGGFPFTIHGTGFGYLTPNVQFDGVDATDVVLVDAQTITGITPAHEEGVVTVTVEAILEGSDNVTIEIVDGYEYVPPAPTPELMTLSPPTGPTAGGTLVTITGANLKGTDGQPAQVQFDGLDGTEETVSEDGTFLTVLTPPHALGRVDVDVLTDAGGVTFLKGFEYYDGPVGNVSGMLWVDLDFDGQWQEDEPKLVNLPLTLERTGDLEPGSLRSSFGMNKSSDVSPQAVFWMGYSDADGNYSIPGLPYGHYVLSYTLPSDLTPTVGGSTNGTVFITIDAPSYIQDAAGAGFSSLVDATVIYNDTKDPVPFCEVALRWSSGDGVLGTDDDVYFPITCDENGQFTIDGLISGEYDLVNREVGGYEVNPNVLTVLAYTDVTEPTWELIRTPYQVPGLPNTGVNQYSTWLAALSLLVLGTAAIAVTRRRRRP